MLEEDLSTAPNPLSSKAAAAGWNLDHSYRRLPSSLFQRARPTPVRKPELVILNRRLAGELGLDPELLSQPEQAGLFTGNLLPEGAFPIAQAYAGHQFGHFTMLGDGRAILLGEQLMPDDKGPAGRRVDVQLKGAGPTPYSRRGDGRAALGPMLREYILSEALEALGVTTSLSLAVATTGEAVYRETPLPGAVLTRVASSHLRVGTFEYAARRDPDLVRALADYAIERHFPEAHSPEAAEDDHPYEAFLIGVVEKQAALIARWLLVGFIHGVINTDNMAISGETIDYGPCAFLDAYDPATVFSSIDHQGRYAYGRQPQIAQWNLLRFAETLLPLLGETPEEAQQQGQEAVDSFLPRFHRHWFDGMKGKLGLVTEENDDAKLINDLLRLMHKQESDYTNTFRDLCEESLPHQNPAYEAWFATWQERLARQPMERAELLARMRSHNPAVIPRNHKVEEALDAASQAQDYAPLHRLLEALANPYDHTLHREDYQQPAPPSEIPYRTFCGT